MLNFAGIAECSVAAQEFRKYYRSESVRDRMREFLGTAVYIAGTDGTSEFTQAETTAHLPEYLESGLEIDRSMWDLDLLIADLDLEYQNFDNPAAPWLNPKRAFDLQRPVLEATLQILSNAGIVPLTLLSGRGFHLVWSIQRKSSCFQRLAGLGRLPASLQARYAEPCSPDGLSVELDLGRAFAGLGMVMEFVWHNVLAAVQTRAEVSVQPAAIEVGPEPQGREIVAFDLSEYGDPLHTRRMRIPFSAYLKPRQFEWLLGAGEVERLLPIFEIPLSGTTPLQAVMKARDPDAVIELSRKASVEIPNASEGMNNLLDQYQRSELRVFHDQFYRQLAEEAFLPADIESIRIPQVPGCLQWLFDRPNDWLLKPAALQHAVRILMALGCDPAPISKLIWTAYLKDSDWRDLWARLDPLNRAVFYTRLFAGMIVTGGDRLVDLNCVSHREKGYCTVPDCRLNLATYRDMLVKRIARRSENAGSISYCPFLAGRGRAREIESGRQN